MERDRQTIDTRRAAFRAQITAETGIDETLIKRVVDAFYARVQKDEMLGPIFDDRIEDWGAHLPRMYAFWSSVLLQSGRYHGRPMQKHLTLPVDGTHFTRWLGLFEQTVDAECPGPAAALFMEKARTIARSLQMGVTQFGVPRLD